MSEQSLGEVMVKRHTRPLIVPQIIDSMGIGLP
jgi:hypothetical protein